MRLNALGLIMNIIIQLNIVVALFWLGFVKNLGEGKICVLEMVYHPHFQEEQYGRSMTKDFVIICFWYKLLNHW